MWQTRIIGVVAALVLIGAVVSDGVNTKFWDRHALLADLVVSLIVVALSVAVINEAVERGQRRRWSVLAQYVLFQLARHARVTWTALAELSGLMPTGDDTEKSVEQGAQAVHDTTRLAAALRGLLADPEQRELLHKLIDRLIDSGDELLGRWASVMISSSAYAEIIDRHVELYSRIVWVGNVAYLHEPADDPDRRRLTRSNPAVPLQRDIDDDQLADYLAGITQLAEALEHGTMQLALRIVPLEWWRTRLSSRTDR